jgi:hypothetical protein
MRGKLHLCKLVASAATHIPLEGGGRREAAGGGDPAHEFSLGG